MNENQTKHICRLSKFLSFHQNHLYLYLGLNICSSLPFMFLTQIYLSIWNRKGRSGVSKILLFRGSGVLFSKGEKRLFNGMSPWCELRSYVRNAVNQAMWHAGRSVVDVPQKLSVWCPSKIPFLSLFYLFSVALAALLYTHLANWLLWITHWLYWN